MVFSKCFVPGKLVEEEEMEDRCVRRGGGNRGFVDIAWLCRINAPMCVVNRLP